MGIQNEPIWLDLATGDFSQVVPDDDVGSIGEANSGNPTDEGYKGIAAVGLSSTVADVQVYTIVAASGAVQLPNMRVGFAGPT